jgi:hypothetical protein
MLSAVLDSGLGLRIRVLRTAILIARRKWNKFVASPIAPTPGATSASRLVRGDLLSRETEALSRACEILTPAGGELDQIPFLLGHVSIRTTERFSDTSKSFESCEPIDSASNRISLDGRAVRVDDSIRPGGSLEEFWNADACIVRHLGPVRK